MGAQMQNRSFSAILKLVSYFVKKNTVGMDVALVPIQSETKMIKSIGL